MEISVVERPQVTLYGIWGTSSDKGQARDIPRLSRMLYALLGIPAGSLLPYYVVSKDYDVRTKAFALFVGGERRGQGLGTAVLPAGLYAETTVRPVLGFLWGPAIGRAKGAFYAQWLPSSGYDARNLEFEYHDARSTGKGRSIQLFFAIENRESVNLKMNA